MPTQTASEVAEKVNGIVEKWERKKGFLIEMLQDIQDSYRYVPEEAINVLCDSLEVPRASAYHITTFYKAFSLEPKGEHVISVCTGTACHVKGAPNLISAFERELSVTLGGTDAAGKFTLEEENCPGCCGLAAVVTVDGEIYGGVTVAGVKKILDKYR